MTLQTKILGRDGEALAVSFLRQQGYKILEQNFRNKLGEIDIIAAENDTLCFIEVKTRKGSRFGSGFEAVSAAKQLKLTRLALSYLQYRKKLNAKARFDVVMVTPQAEGTPQIELVKNAFDAAETAL